MQHYDLYLRVTKGREEYHLDKVKAGAIGGSRRQLPPNQEANRKIVLMYKANRQIPDGKNIRFHRGWRDGSSIWPEELVRILNLLLGEKGARINV